MSHPQSADEWLHLCRQRRTAANTLRVGSQPNMCWEQTGFGVEACLKAAIMKAKGMNRWPSTVEDPKLWTHDLEALAKRLGIDPDTFDPRDPAAASWKMVFEWQRGHGYSIEKFPMRYATQMYEAAFGSNGVVEWLARRYQLNI